MVRCSGARGARGRRGRLGCCGAGRGAEIGSGRARLRCPGMPWWGVAAARRSIGVEPLVQLLVSLALVRYGSHELSGEPVVAGLALGVAALLIAAIVGSRLLSRRLRRMAAGR
jgi:hypothetical protein